MAITADVSHGLIFLRPFVEQKISAAGWKALFEQKSSINFDGEIMVFGYLSYPALQDTLIISGHMVTLAQKTCLVIMAKLFGESESWVTTSTYFVKL